MTKDQLVELYEAEHPEMNLKKYVTEVLGSDMSTASI